MDIHDENPQEFGADSSVSEEVFLSQSPTPVEDHPQANSEEDFDYTNDDAAAGDYTAKTATDTETEADGNEDPADPELAPPQSVTSTVLTRENPPVESASPPSQLSGLRSVGDEEPPQSSVMATMADTDVAPLSDIDSILEEKPEEKSKDVQTASPVAQEDSDLGDPEQSEPLFPEGGKVDQLDGASEEEDLVPNVQVSDRGLPQGMGIGQPAGDEPQEQIDEVIPPSLHDAVRVLSAQQGQDTRDPDDDTPRRGEEQRNPMPVAQTSANPANDDDEDDEDDVLEEPAQVEQRAMPSLPSRPRSGTGPRPAGMGGGLPPRPAGPGPSGMGAGLPPRPGPRPAPAPRPMPLAQPRPDGNVPAQLPEETPEVRHARAQLMDVRLMMLRMALRLGMAPMDISVQEFMNKVDMTERVRYPIRAGPFRPQIDALFTRAMEMDQEQGSSSDLDAKVTALVLGSVGSGKTSVIRNLLNQGNGLVGTFPSHRTTKITKMSGKVCGVDFTFIDTPGLSLSASALGKNMSILKNIKAAISKDKPDVVIYVDRMDLFRRELSDVPLLRLINEMLPEMLYSAIVLLTRGGAPPPDHGQAEMQYNEYHRLRLDLCTQIISHAISDMRWGGRPMAFENHPSCRTNAQGVPVLPNGAAFKKQAIYTLLASRMYRKVEKICQTSQFRRRTLDQMMQLMQPRRQLQLSALVAQLLTSKHPKKYPEEERELKTDSELEGLQEGMKMVEENKRRDYVRMRRVEILQEEQHPSQVPVVGHQLELNPSFDHEVNQHRYNATDFVGGWSVRPISSMPEQTFDHDDGVESFQVAREGVLRGKGQYIGGCPASMIVQAGKTKGPASVTLDVGVSAYKGRNVVGTVGAMVHPAGQDGELVYTPSAEVRVKTAENNKTGMGVMACRLSESGWPNKGQLSYGAKVENKYKIKDGVKLIGALGFMTMKVTQNQPRDLAYGANLDLKLAGGKGDYDPSFLMGVAMSTQKRGNYSRTGFSGQISAEKPVTDQTMINGRLNMNTGGTGTMAVRAITHDKAEWGWLMALPLALKAFKRVMGQGEEYV